MTIVFATRSSSTKPMGVVGRCFLSLFFLVFLGMGLLFVWLMARDIVGGLQTRTWTQTPCEIISSGVASSGESGDRSGDFRLEIQYRYRFAGQTFTSDRYQRKPVMHSDYGRLARLAAKFPPEAGAVCYVNPSAPAEAVLVRGRLSSAFALLFPMIFVAIGAGGIFFIWRAGSARSEAARPISDRAALGKGRGVLMIVGLVFALIGGGVFYGLFLRPAFKILDARRWARVPCVVISSEVRSHEGDDGATYSVNILYSYRYQSREFKSNAYDLMGGSSSGYAGKAEIVSRHAPGTETVCYVNPADPTEAVLIRDFTPTMWFGVIPLVFVLVGLGLSISIVRKRSEPNPAGWPGKGAFRAAPTVAGAQFLSESDCSGSVVLKPKTAPLAKLIFIVIMALFWNGIVSVFVAQAVHGWRSGGSEWFLSVFLIPFVLVGLGLVIGVFYTFLALFNPRARLTVTPGAARLGRGLNVQWEIIGRANRLQNLSIVLEGTEEAQYRRGTDTCTDRSVFAQLKIASLMSLMDEFEFRSGQRSVTIPAGLMHSFESTNNKILWTLHVHGEIARWPDLREEFPIVVMPSEVAS